MLRRSLFRKFKAYMARDFEAILVKDIRIKGMS